MNSLPNMPMRTFTGLEYWWRMQLAVPVVEACA